MRRSLRGTLAAGRSMVCAGVMSVASAGSLVSQATPSTDQFQVNNFTSGSQDSASISATGNGLLNGFFVVVWQSAGSVGSDQDGTSIQGQKFTHLGQPFGLQFQVNSYGPGNQTMPAIAMNPVGEFVVVWQSSLSSFPDVSGTSIQARRFTSFGSPAPQFGVNTYTPGDQTAPAITRDASGQFIIVYESAGSVWGDTSGRSVLARRFASDGSALGVEFQVNGYTTGDQTQPQIAYMTGGQFVVVWKSAGSSGSDAASASIQSRRFDSAGSPLAPDFQVNQSTNGDQVLPAVSSASTSGDFVVAWESFSSFGTDTSSTSVQARRFNPSGGAGSEFQVNTYTTGLQGTPAVMRDARGDFVITWQSYGSDGPDTQFQSIRAMRAFANGAPIGGEFQIEQLTTDHDFDAVVSSDPDGNFVVAWTALDSIGGDTSPGSIQARIFDALFRDGFESGNFSRWTFAFPLSL